MDVARRHSALVQELGSDWHSLYEFNVHSKTLTLFRARVAQWTREVAPPLPRLPESMDFELAAWRVLGAGAMLLDAYEQSVKRAQETKAAQSSLRHWLRGRWRRFLTVLHWSP